MLQPPISNPQPRHEKPSPRFPCSPVSPCRASAAAGRSTEEEAAKLKEWFAGKGVTWPEGSRLTLPVPGTLTVANTQENLDRIEYILRQLPSQQPKP